MSKQPPADEGFILEFHRSGAFVKVTAVDPRTGVEASIVGDPRAGEAALGRAAIQKLRYVLDKRDKAAPGRGGPAKGGRGQLV